jgi:hypothetical protein
MRMLTSVEDCNCFAARAAARHITQVYDQLLAPAGLRTTQFSILAKLKRLGPLTIKQARQGHGDGSHDARAEYPAAGAGWSG